MATFGITRSLNEVDLLEYSIRRMVRQVDHVIIGDNSTDGGREVLEGLVAEGLPITLLEDTKLNWQQREVMTEYAFRAADMGADWVCPFDIDEAWLPCEGARISRSLATVPETILVAVAANLTHSATTEDDMTNPDPMSRMKWRSPERLPLGKVACRVLPGLEIGHGNHSATYKGVRHVPTVQGVIESRHFPYRTAEQFVKRVQHAWPMLRDSGLPQSHGAHMWGYGDLLDRAGPEGLAEPRRFGVRPVVAALMGASVVVPVGGDEDEWRRLARTWVVDRYATLHPDWELIEGCCARPWSKGAALADGVNRATGDILVLADADSYVPVDTLERAVGIVEADPRKWVVPHGNVYRLKQDETLRVYDGAEAQRRQVVRPRYTGLPGGGIVVLSREVWDEVGGVDPRFQGWGGEDLTFGWVLCVLVGWYERLGANLFHLWHPHPAPDLRGSPDSEALVAVYKAAWKVWKRTGDAGPMRALIDDRRSYEPASAHALQSEGDPARRVRCP
jgi:glycosyltransferase involved in cell wall biosynthesis